MSSPAPGPRKCEDVVWLLAGRPFSPLVGATRTGREARGCGLVHRPEPAVVWRVPGKGKFSHFPARKKYLKVTKVAGVSKANKQKNNSETPVLDRAEKGSQRTETLYFVSVCPRPVAQEEACISPVVVLVNPAF